MRCPACAFSLMRAPTSWQVFGCTGCGGVWADAAAASHVQTALDRNLVALAERASANFGDRPPPADTGARPCAICSAVMTRAVIAMTQVDVCAEHGMWFDRGELEMVARRLEAQRASGEVEEARSEGAGGVVASAAGEVALDVVLGILGTVVESVF